MAAARVIRLGVHATKLPLLAYRDEAQACTRCQDGGAIYKHNDTWARPLFDRHLNCPSGVLVVAEAPNFDDTFVEGKGYLTYDIESDPTGNFARELLASVALTTTDVLFTNAVLCLPKARDQRHPVTGKLMRACSPWLQRLIDDVQPRVVATFGLKALSAVRLIEKHGLRKLADHAGKPVPWYGRQLLPLFHPGRLGRISRSAAAQLADIAVLRGLLADKC